MHRSVDDALQADGFAEVLVLVQPGGQAPDVTLEIGSAATRLDRRLSPLYSDLAQAFVGARTESVPSNNTGIEGAYSYFPRLGVVLGRIDVDGAAVIERQLGVTGYGLAPTFRLIGSTVVEGADAAVGQWGIDALGVKAAWSRGLFGAGVSVGHLDTGVDDTHAALAGAVAEFKEIDKNGVATSITKSFDRGEHGTHTAGTICGRAYGAHAFGVAPKARLLAAMVVDENKPLRAQRIIAGLEWIALKRPRIVNLSIGTDNSSADFAEVIGRVRAAGVLPIAAIGNNIYPGPTDSPANYDNVLSVGAFDSNGRIPADSSSQQFVRPKRALVPDLVAPGVGVVSAKAHGDIAVLSGTSMAAPHISGLAALLAQAKPQATASEIEDAILASCVLPPTMQKERANRGIPDASRALQALGV